MMFYMGDFDVHGMDIYLDYLFGSEHSIFEAHGNPTLIHIGLTISDVDNFQKGKIKVNLKELMKIDKILSRRYFDPQDMAT